MIHVTKEYDLTGHWTNHAIENTPIDCQINFRLLSPPYFLTLDSSTGVDKLVQLATDWSDLGEYSTTLEAYYVNYDTPATTVSTMILSNVTANCREPTTWTVLTTSIVNHRNAFSIFDLEATSLALTHDPITCYLDWSIDQLSDASIASILDISHFTSASGEIRIDDVTTSIPLGTFTFVIKGNYPGFEPFDPYAST